MFDINNEDVVEMRRSGPTGHIPGPHKTPRGSMAMSRTRNVGRWRSTGGPGLFIPTSDFLVGIERGYFGVDNAVIKPEFGL